ncbi:hypothetical protein [uncultured Bacteroides sp.]|uniref:hypothetical protein n=1 Tax=uncultured Bacteroides sp. TaxID=162156 RepID=UPI002AAB280F|nr:hypothetical protein [uncultured Bacteroides sp.]
MKKATLLFILFTLLPSLSTYAVNEEWKSGCIITNNGDTIRGFIAYQNQGNSSENCLFKKSNSETEDYYIPNQIKGYKYDIGLYYESLQLRIREEKKNLFAECLVQGGVSLFYLETNNFSSYYAVYATSGKTIPFNSFNKEILSFLEKRRIRKYLELIFNNDPLMKEEINKCDCSRSAFMDLFQKYNNLACTEQLCISYLEPKHKYSLYITPYVGMQLNSIKYNVDFNDNRSVCRDLTPLIGADLYINADRNSEKIMFNLGLYASQINIGRNKEPLLKKDFKATQIVNNLGLQYYFIKYKTRPFIEAGVSQLLMFKGNDTESKKIDIYNYNVGVYFSTGISIPIKGGNAIPIKLNYSIPFRIPQTLYLINNSLALSIGYTFKLK